MGLGRKHRRGFQEIGYAFVLVKSSDVQEEPLSTDARSRPRRVAGDEVLIRERRREDCDFLRRNPSLDQPGDITWRGKNSVVYFPIATSIVVSIVLSLILYLISRFRG